MVVIYRAGMLLWIIFAMGCSVAQNGPQSPMQTGGLATVLLDQVSTVQIPSLPAGSIAMPVFCEQDGDLLFRLVTPDTGVQDPVSVSRDGKTVVQFSKWKINDINDPVLISVYPHGSDVYILLTGSVPLGRESK